MLSEALTMFHFSDFCNEKEGNNVDLFNLVNVGAVEWQLLSVSIVELWHCGTQRTPIVHFIHRAAIVTTAFCPPTCLYDWLVQYTF